MSMQMARQENHIGGAAYFDLKLTYELGPLQLKSLIESGDAVQVVDVRRAESFAAERIAHAINLPFEPEQGVQYLYHLNKNVQIVIVSYGLYCTLAYEAAYLLARNGYRVRCLIGGMEGWQHYALPVEKGTEAEPHQELFHSVAADENTDEIFW